MEQKGLVKSGINLPGFVQNAYESVEQMEKFADLLLGSKLCPDHFYEKGADNKPDYTKGKTEAVVMVLLQGHQLQLPPLTALQHIIPVNGLLSVKGDAAKSMIFGSGKLANESWKEESSGSIQDGTYQVTISAKRTDGQALVRSFSVEDAKRAGLWITDSQLKGKDGWKYRKSAWYKYPARMIAYRALGFLARDLFPDIMSGIYTTEEAMDLPQDETMVIETSGGAEIEIPDKNFAQDRSQTLTSKAAEKIDKINELDPEQVLRQHTATPEECYPSNDPEPYTEEMLKEMPMDELLIIIADNDLEKHLETIPGKNTNKKLRSLILVAQEGPGVLASYLTRFDPNYSSEKIIDNAVKNNESEEKAEKSSPPEEIALTVKSDEDGPPMEAIQNDDDNQETPEDNRDIAEAREEINEELPAGPPEPQEENKFGIDVPELDEQGKRSFDQVKALFEDMQSIAGIDNKRYESLIETKFIELQKYATKEDLCYKAEKSEINALLKSIE